MRVLWANNFKNRNFSDVGVHFGFLNAATFEITNNAIFDAVLLGTLYSFLYVIRSIDLRSCFLNGYSRLPARNFGTALLK